MYEVYEVYEGVCISYEYKDIAGIDVCIYYTGIEDVQEKEAGASGHVWVYL